jgi:membrane-associated phospholipid phosphatase
MRKSQNMKQLRLLPVVCLTLFTALTNVTLGHQHPAPERSEYLLSRSEILTDLAVTASLGLTQVLIPLDKDSQRLFPDEVNSLDRSMRDRWHTRSDNFLDGSIGALYTPAAIGAIITVLNLAERASTQKTGSELLIFANGAFANKFLTKSFKRAFSRRRPELDFANEADKIELEEEDSAHESFYSGHASTAFFSAAFLRRRMSQSLAQRGHSGIGSGYQWLTVTVLYSWAAYVGYSRVQIDKHYFTDVAAGMVMGLVFEEIYHQLNRGYWNSYSSWRPTLQVDSGTLQLCLVKNL